MTRRQKEFGRCYAVLGDPCAAAEQAGYKKPEQRGRAMLADPEIAAYASGYADGRASTEEGLPEEKEVLKHYARLMRGEAEEGEAPPAVRDRLRAAELLARHMHDSAKKGPSELKVKVEYV